MSGELQRISKMATSQDRFTPELRSWLASHPEGVGVETQEEALLLLRLLTVTTQKSRDGAFHPSGLTRCAREQMFGYRGEDRVGHSHGSQLQNIFNDGTWRHARWQLMLMKIGILHSVEVPVSLPGQRLVGSMDGQGTGTDGEEWFCELKGTSRALTTIEKEGPSVEHLVQVHAYLLASGLHQAVMVYEAKGYNDWIEIPVERDESIITDIQAKLDYLNGHAVNNTLPPILADCRNRTGEVYDSCPYAATCLEAK